MKRKAITQNYLMSEELRSTSSSSELVRKILSRYLQNEARYDRWGAQGKLIVATEVFREEGLSVGTGILEKLVNSIFPRTFLPFPKTTIHPVLLPSVVRYYREKSFEFSREAIDPGIAIEETATRFNITSKTVCEILGNLL
jgi:hypothetical protein